MYNPWSSVQICRIWNNGRSRQKCLYGLKDKSNDETCSKGGGRGWGGWRKPESWIDCMEPRAWMVLNRQRRVYILMTGQSEHVCKTECTIVGAAGVKRKQLRLITWNNSGKYIRWAKRGVWYKIFHITDVFYWGNPNHGKSLPLLPTLLYTRKLQIRTQQWKYLK